jgi:poly [ADP-ribose] polymerase 10/14/15
MDPAAVVAVPAGSDEYADVQRRFDQTARGAAILRVERVQNPCLWGKYSAGRHTMGARAPPSAGARELRLFHGTRAESAARICVQGFNRAFAGQNATLFGRGVYFARDATYSAQDTYSPPDAAGERRMFLALVAVGDCCRGGRDAPVPPRARPGAATAHDLCDSTVDDPAAPAVFVTYNDTQQYPDYLITFRKL